MLIVSDQTFVIQVLLVTALLPSILLAKACPSLPVFFEPPGVITTDNDRISDAIFQESIIFFEKDLDELSKIPEEEIEQHVMSIEVKRCFMRTPFCGNCWWSLRPRYVRAQQAVYKSEKDRLTFVVFKRDLARDVFPLQSVGVFWFLECGLSQHPKYSTLLERACNSTSDNTDPLTNDISSFRILDLGTCLGRDLRKLLYDGAPPTSLYGSDTFADFEDIGHAPSPQGPGVRNTQMWKVATGSIGGKWHIWTGYNPEYQKDGRICQMIKKRSIFFEKDELVRITLFIERMS